MAPPPSLTEKVQKIKHELGLDEGLAMAAALQSANEMMGLRGGKNYTLPEQADLLLSVRAAAPRRRAAAAAVRFTRPCVVAGAGLHRTATSRARRCRRCRVRDGH